MQQLYSDPARCCGCAACVSVCPHGAVSMAEDAHGFRYPKIDDERCVDCGLCEKVCPFITPAPRRTAPTAYAAQDTDAQRLSRSASGGAFAALAAAFLEQGGAVCGAAMEKRDGQMAVRHLVIENAELLPRLQGSKYVQSTMDGAWTDMERVLKGGQKLLFSGTPCQVAAVKNRFRRFEDQLFCLDIVCHGVPNQRLFNDHLTQVGKCSGMEIDEFCFRDKSHGWGLRGYLRGRLSGGRSGELPFSRENSSYYTLFLDGEIYRDSCYTCPFASAERPGDLTIGDFWGLKKHNSKLLAENGGPLNQKTGVSCLLVNTEKGEQLLASCGGMLARYPVEPAHVIAGNTQLRQPSQYTALRDKVFRRYEKQGYAGVERLLFWPMLKKKWKRRIAKRMPKGLKTVLQKIRKALRGK